MDRRSMPLHGFLMNLLVPAIESLQGLSTPSDKSYKYTGPTSTFHLEIHNNIIMLNVDLIFYYQGEQNLRMAHF